MAKLHNVLAFAALVSAFTWEGPTFAAQNGNDACAGLRGVSYFDCQRAVAATRAAARWRTYQRKFEAWERFGAGLLILRKDARQQEQALANFDPERSQLEGYRSAMAQYQSAAQDLNRALCNGHICGSVKGATLFMRVVDPNTGLDTLRSGNDGNGGGVGGRN